MPTLRRIVRRKKRTSTAVPADSRPTKPRPGSSPSHKKKIKYDPDEPLVATEPLTVREEDVHYWVVRGKENDEIAALPLRPFSPPLGRDRSALPRPR